MKSKAKGNSFEIKLSKLLSQWMFNNPNVLWRDSTSGGRKIIYNGDIIPAQIDNFSWTTWPFIIEAKHGYKEHIPTLMNQKKLKSWLIKLLSERTESQYIPILIAQFHNNKAILLTPLLLNVYCDICLKILGKDNIYYDFYVYDLKTILNEKFENVMPLEIISNLEKNI